MIALLACVAAACTSGDSSDDATKTGGGSNAPSTTLDPQEVAKHPGVTADAIKLGIAYVDLKTVTAVKIDQGDFEAAYRAVIDDLNRKGGINGRRIDPVFAPINPLGTSSADAACLKVTEDEPVFAYIGFFLGDTVLCPLENHDTAVLGGEMNPERLRRAKAPWFAVGGSTDNQTDGVKALAEDGDLDGKLAVFAQTTDGPLMNDTILPLLKGLGIKPVSTAILEAGTDINATITQAGVIAQKFKAAGAEKVLVVGNGGTAWAEGLAKSDYRPQSIFIGTGTILAYAGSAAGADLTVLENSLAADTFLKQFSEPKMQTCIKIVEKAIGQKIPDPDTVAKDKPNPFVSAAEACRELTLFEALAKAAGKDLNYATFRAAAAKASPIAIPGYPDPMTFGAPPHADGDPKVYVYQWNPGPKRFDPTS